VIDDEAEADDQFWNQEFFAAEQADDSYEEEAEQEDVVDSDFYQSVRPRAGKCCCTGIVAAASA
jgi:hypothetical protein